MPINIDTENLVHFVEAAKLFPGRKPCIQSLHRWRLTGVLVHGTDQRVKLETVKVSGLRYTSAAAVRRFIDAANQQPDSTPVITPGQRQRQSQAARKALAEIGIGT